jgi:hypothetical protein
MSTETNRWWEYYLPRYLMPSVAGVVIVNWLSSYGGDGFRALLALPANGKSFDTTSLILLFLYGNLFCYVASYPVLVFHATRVMDFRKAKWQAIPLRDGYVTTLIVVAFAVAMARTECRYRAAFFTALVFAAIQVGRIYVVLFHRFKVKHHGDKVSHAYFYSYVLAHRRGIPIETTEKEVRSPQVSRESSLTTEKEDEDDETRTVLSHTNSWRREFMDTYRHLREHGNSAFIFILEMGLAALVFCVLSKPNRSAGQEIGAVGVLFGIWAAPSMLVHLLAQHLERRFSRYDQKLRSEVIHS